VSNTFQHELPWRLNIICRSDHLDVLNVKWLEDYLVSLTSCTSIIVSHDSAFLNNTVSDILYLNRFKLRRYPGNLNAFVKFVPEAKTFFELSAQEDYQFKFPDPPLLEGVKTKEKSIMKMRKVGFQYPTSKVQQLHDITLQVSLSSRVAVLGPNGESKSAFSTQKLTLCSNRCRKVDSCQTFGWRD
jgi:elongation factor 3